MEQSTTPATIVTPSAAASSEAPQENVQNQEIEVNPFKGTKHKYKAKGKEIEVDYDTLLSKASLADGAQETFKEAKEIRQEFEDRLGRLSNAEMENWDEIIDLIGVEKALKFASTVNEKHSYWTELSEEQREDILFRHEAELAKQELESLKGKEKQAAVQQASREAYAAINQEIGEALEEAKANGVPLSDLPDIATAIVDEMLMVLEQIEAEEKAGRKWSGKAPTAKDVVKKLQGQYEDRSATYIKKLNAKQLKSMLTPEQLAELRQEEIDALHSGATPNRMTSQSEQVNRTNYNQNQNVPVHKKSNDFFKDMDKKYGVRP